MRFLLLVHSPRSRWGEVPADGTDDEMDRHLALIEELDSHNRLVDCCPLAPPEQVVTVRVRAGQILATVDPADSDEEDLLAGYYLLETRTAAEAVEVAARVPDAATSKVLVHPLLQLAAVPTGPRQSIDGQR